MAYTIQYCRPPGLLQRDPMVTYVQHDIGKDPWLHFQIILTDPLSDLLLAFHALANALAGASLAAYRLPSYFAVSVNVCRIELL